MNASTAPLPDERLIEVTRRFSYPPTPDVAEAVMKRLESGGRPRARMRSAWAVTGLLVLLLAVLLFAVPGVRAEIVRFFQVGVVRIFPADATQTAIPASSPIPLTPYVDENSFRNTTWTAHPAASGTCLLEIPSTFPTAVNVTTLGMRRLSFVIDPMSATAISVRMCLYGRDRLAEH